MYSRPFSSRRRVYESLFAWIVGLIDEISTERIHIEEKSRGNFFYLFAYGDDDLPHLVVLITFETIIVLTTVDASCRLLLLFLSGSSQESMLWRTLRNFFVCRYRYFLEIFLLICLRSSLRSPDVFPVVASLPPKRRPEIRLRFAG